VESGPLRLTRPYGVPLRLAGPSQHLAPGGDIVDHDREMSEVQEGDVLAGKYRVERVLGEGGMGIVVAATHIALEERVALKFMRAEATQREDGVERFLREARAAVKLKSEHVARVLDVGTLETGSPYIVMEYLEGSDLSEVLIQRGKLTLGEAVEYLLQACDAIAEAHSRGIIHRDLKPANLFVTRARDGAPLLKVLDFGISKMNVLGDRPESMTQSTAILGSPMYMSPEQMKSSRDVSPTTDIWSLGIILYEAVGGRVPFDEQTIGALMAKVLTQHPPALQTLRGDLPEPFVAVVARCLEKEPTQRYASVAELARALVPFATTPVEDRVARIEAMQRDIRGSSTPSLPDSAERGSRGDLGIAATQPLTASSWSATGEPPAKRRGAGKVVAVVAVASLLTGGVVFGAMHLSGKPAATTVAPVDPPPAPPPAATSAAPVSTAATPSATADTTPDNHPPATTPSAAPAVTGITAPRHPDHRPPPPTTKPGPPRPDPADPFGKSRQ
jgi:serine/threonine protein kinase